MGEIRRLGVRLKEIGKFSSRNRVIWFKMIDAFQIKGLFLRWLLAVQ